MRVAIVYNQPKCPAPREHWLSRSQPGTVIEETFKDASECGVVEQARLIEDVLRSAGYDTVLYGANVAGSLMEFLSREHPDLIFNCCESLGGNASLEMNVAALFEIAGIPFTGSPALTLGMALNKDLAKSLFVANGIPTPPWAVLSPHRGLDHARRLEFPLIVKPLREDASIGIGAHSIVDGEPELLERARFIWREFRQPALAEEFIEGRELNVAVLADGPEQFVTLPVSEIVFDGYPDHQRKILTYEAKWIKDSPYYTSTVPRCPAELCGELADPIRSLAVDAAAAVQLRDYGRIDFRVRSSDGGIFVLEANPNPDISSDSGFIRAAQASGRTYAGVILEIVESARSRAREKDHRP
ncbi:MAG TPA: hypothetical protein VL285_10670 [Bryobacteraceae bacterium]|nr:hypothetical protein [Bryobacteraceae bacterium]